MRGLNPDLLSKYIFGLPTGSWHRAPTSLGNSPFEKRENGGFCYRNEVTLRKALHPPDVKNSHTGEVPDAGKD